MFSNNMKKKIQSIVLLFFIVLNFLGEYGSEVANASVIHEIKSITTNESSEYKTIDIIEVTDFHGELLDMSNTKQIGASLAKAIKDVKNLNPNGTLIIGGGDLYQGTSISNVLRGVPVQQILSNIGMEVTTLGNHEFDWKIDVINKLTMKNSNYSIVCSNVYKKNTLERCYEPYKIINKNGVRIAVIGAILQNAAKFIIPTYSNKFDFKNPATEINECAAEIRNENKADIILADIHDGGNSLVNTVKNLHQVDAVFGGHSHTVFDSVIKDADGKDVPTLNGNSNGKGYIDLKITLDSNNKIVGFSPEGKNYFALTTTTTSPVDEECKAIVDAVSLDLLPIFNEVIGYDTQAYTKIQSDTPFGDSQLGNWVADVIKKEAKADIGIVNNGGIRLSSSPIGNISVEYIFRLMPFDSLITTVKMTGSELKNVFEQSVADKTGEGVQISGVKFEYDSSKQSYKEAVLDSNGKVIIPGFHGERVIKIIKEEDNSVVGDNDIFLVAATNYVSKGGDGVTEFTLPSIQYTYDDLHKLLRDSLIEDVGEQGKITVTMNERIKNTKN